MTVVLMYQKLINLICTLLDDVKTNNQADVKTLSDNNQNTIQIVFQDGDVYSYV